MINCSNIRKIIICLIIIIGLLQISPTVACATSIKYAKTTVNIRAKPNKKSKIVGVKYWNQPIRVIGKVNKQWSKISYHGKVGYFYSKYLKSRKSQYRKYDSPSSNSFKSYEDAKCIKDKSSPNYKLKGQYKLDPKSGVYMVGNRYCIALGSYYATKIGTKIDLVLRHNGKNHILKCILADQKSDDDTIKNHKVHSDGSIAEFIVNTGTVPELAKYTTGDISYAGKQFRGRIVQIRVYGRKDKK